MQFRRDRVRAGLDASKTRRKLFQSSFTLAQSKSHRSGAVKYAILTAGVQPRFHQASSNPCCRKRLLSMAFAFDNIDTLAKRMLLAFQEYSLFCWEAVANVLRAPHYWSDVMTQCDLIGVGSLPIVVLTGFFTGGV